MNRTHFEHIFYALIMQFAIGLATDNWWAGAAFGGAFFIGREHAQREYHKGDPSHLGPFDAFDFLDWSLDSKLDLLAPCVAVVVMAMFATHV